VQRTETRLEKLTTTVEEKQKELLEAQEELAKHLVNLAAARVDLLPAQERVVQTTIAQVASSKGPLAAISAAFGDIPEEVATSASCLALQGVLQQAAVLLAAVQAEAAAAREAAAKAATAAADNSGESSPEQQGPRCDASDQDMAEDADITEEEVAQFLALEEHRDMAASFTTEEARKKLAFMLRGFKKVSRAKGSKGHPLQEGPGQEVNPRSAAYSTTGPPEVLAAPPAATPTRAPRILRTEEVRITPRRAIRTRGAAAAASSPHTMLLAGGKPGRSCRKRKLASSSCRKRMSAMAMPPPVPLLGHEPTGGNSFSPPPPPPLGVGRVAE
jgi:hypothetical protein